MSPLEIQSIQAEVKLIEASLQTFEAILENTNNRPLYEASLCLVDALKRLHEFDPQLVNAANRTRIEELAAKQKVKPGRDYFNTGF